MKRSMLTLFCLGILFLLGGCICGPVDMDCGKHGEEVEMSCICDDGWFGLFCETNIHDHFQGTYEVIEQECDSIDIPWETVTAKPISNNLNGLTFETPGLLRPMEGTFYEFQGKFQLKQQRNLVVDSTGVFQAVEIEGYILNYRHDTLWMKLDSGGCSVKMVKR